MSDHEQLDRALDELIAGRSPRAQAEGLDSEEQRMLRAAQLLRGSRGEEPDDEFIESLHARLFPTPTKVSRRTAFLGALGGLAAGILGGVGLQRWVASEKPAYPHTALVGKNGRWVAVADLAALPHGTVKAFKAGHIQGFLFNRHGQIRGLSRICTHMGCRLDFEEKEQAFVCPCHGAEFAMSGRLRYGPRGYPLPLPPLPPVETRTRDGKIEVWTV
ncbi:MAG TPA: Rieske 2Fe-2S domain-containing protein [Chloroflexota bacterium]|nr:Rieske 2Fe-2S domain-containing protein [Chloroflexota bacterium]